MRPQGELTGYHKYLQRLSAERRRNAVALLDTFSELLGSRRTSSMIDWASIPEQDYRAAVQNVHRSFPTRTANAMRSHIQAVLHEEYLMGRLSLQQLEALRRAWEEPTGDNRRRKSGVDHTVRALVALLDTCERDATLRGARDGALIALIWILKLSPSDLVKLPVGGELGNFTGGGSDPALQRALHRWLELRGVSPGPILLSIHRRGCIHPVPMTRTSVTAAIKQRGWQAGIDGITASSLIATAAFSTQLAE